MDDGEGDGMDDGEGDGKDGEGDDMDAGALAALQVLVAACTASPPDCDELRAALRAASDPEVA